MLLRVLACGPDGTDLLRFIAIGGVGLLVVKPLLYVAFVLAFRYRVAAPVPMRPSQAWGIAGLRTIMGAFVIGGTWLALYFTDVHNDSAVQIGWAVALCERLVVWFGLGRMVARLRGRRLLGWTLSGVGIDAACDAGLYYAVDYGLASPALALGALAVFIGGLYFVGKRESLRNRFSDGLLCRGCGYELTGNLSGVCPECGKAVAV